MLGSFLYPCPMRDSPDHRPKPLQNRLCSLHRSIRLIRLPARLVEKLISSGEPDAVIQRILFDLGCNHVLFDPPGEDR